MSKVKKKTLRETDKYIARIEEVHGNLFIHIEVKGVIDLSLIRELQGEWKLFKEKIKKAGYPALYSYSATPKFYQFFKGYEDMGPMDWDEGQYRVLKWELNS